MGQAMLIKMLGKGYNCISNGNSCLSNITTFILLIYLFFSPGFAWGDAGKDSIVEYRDNLFICQADETPLNIILDELIHKCQLEISGLEDREDEPVSFNFKGSIVEGIRELMKYLGEKNFTFEFNNAKLSRVILSRKKDLNALKPFRIVLKNESPTVAIVHDIAEGSQAEKFGLKINDIIQEYDGVQINTAKQLKKEVAAKKDKNKIIMVVQRNDESLSLELSGGIIGVQVGTELIQNESEEEWGDEEEW